MWPLEEALIKKVGQHSQRMESFTAVLWDFVDFRDATSFVPSHPHC